MSTSSTSRSRESQRQRSDRATTPSIRVDGLGSGPIELKNLFEKLILDNGDVCSRCFRRHYAGVRLEVSGQEAETLGDLHGYEQVEGADSPTGQVTVVRWEASNDVQVCYPPRLRDLPRDWMASHGYDPEEMDPEDVNIARLKRKQATPPPKRYCICGAVDQDGDRAPLSKTEAVEEWYPRLAKRLQEHDVPFDTLKLEATIIWAKSHPDLTSKENEVRYFPNESRERRLNATKKSLSV